MKYSCEINLDINYCSVIDTIHIKNDIVSNLLLEDNITYELWTDDGADVALYSLNELLELKNKINESVKIYKAKILSGNFDFIFCTDDKNLYSKIKLLVGV